MLDKLHNFITSKATSEEKGSQALHSDSEKMMSLWIILLCLLFDPLSAYGSSSLQGIQKGAPCFTARNVTGCDKSEPEPRNYSHTKCKVPEICNVSETLFFLFTPKNPCYPEFLHECGGRLPNDTYFNPQFPTVIIIHGWLDGTCRTAWMREMRDQLFIKGNYNIILADWTWGNTLDLKIAADNVIKVACDVCRVIGYIKNQTGVGPKNFHLIGHSLGAHTAGLVGQCETVERVTGLDPAFPPYHNKPPCERLDPTDAKCVDVIHTDGGYCFPFNLGAKDPLGCADFYPNGGDNQHPACDKQIIDSILKGDFLYALFSILPMFCNHLHSTQLFKASINPGICQFIALKANDYKSFEEDPEKDCGNNGTNCAIMGMDWNCCECEKNVTNTYFLKTTVRCPYCDNSYLNLNGFNATNSTHCTPH